jgi:rSAM/selenodomain-associated transferase 2
LKVSVIIPVINEAANLEQLLPFLNNFSGDFLAEIIVADGGSTDNSEAITNKHGLKFFKCSRKGRSVQMNEAAAFSMGEILYFLHADSRPPKEFTNDIFEAVKKGHEAGCFRMDFDSRHWLLRLSAWFTQFNFTWCRGGDQSLFVTRKVFNAAGKYDEKLIIYEDNEILERIRKQTSFCVIQKRIVTSARRFRENGTIRLYLVFMWIHTRYRLGASHEQLLAYYKKHVR